MTMKERCDNECATCPMQGQVYCALAFAKASNGTIKALDERMGRIEKAISAMSVPSDFIEPIEDLLRETPYAESEE